MKFTFNKILNSDELKALDYNRPSITIDSDEISFSVYPGSNTFFELYMIGSEDAEREKIEIVTMVIMNNHVIIDVKPAEYDRVQEISKKYNF